MPQTLVFDTRASSPHAVISSITRSNGITWASSSRNRRYTSGDAFGICVGCKIYNAFSRQQAQHCSGGACEVFTPHASQKVGAGGTVIVVLFLALIGVIARQGFPAADPVTPAVPIGATSGADDRCTPPAFAVAMGHAEKWKLHNNCK